MDLERPLPNPMTPECKPYWDGARDGKLIVDPCIPTEIGRIQLTGANAFGKKWEIEAVGTQSHVRLAP